MALIKGQAITLVKEVSKKRNEKSVMQWRATRKATVRKAVMKMAMMTMPPLVLTRIKTAKVTLVMALRRTTVHMQASITNPANIALPTGQYSNQLKCKYFILTQFMANIHIIGCVFTTRQAEGPCKEEAACLPILLTSYQQQDESGNSGVSKH
jgi:hypothetical protein